jgi:hypothetical protein
MEELKKHSTIITFIGQILVVASFYFNMKSDILAQSKEIEVLKMFAQESRLDRKIIHDQLDIDSKTILVEMAKIQKDIQFIKERLEPKI